MTSRFEFPDIPPDLYEHIFRDDKKLLIVGVIGKSSVPDCNKMISLDILDSSIISSNDNKEGKITFYYKKIEKILFVHFETLYDNYCMLKYLEDIISTGNFEHFMSFNSIIRTKFARTLLFAIQVCHIIVFVENNISFDVSFLSLFKSLKIIRENYVLKFLPKFVKNSTSTFLGKDGRLCAPRFIFFFENYPDGYDRKDTEAVSKLEFEVEDNIYKMLRSEFIITNNSSMSLFSIPSNKRFVYYNTDKEIRADPLETSINYFNQLIEKSNLKTDFDDDLEELRPYKGFGIPLKHYPPPDEPIDLSENKKNFFSLLMEHVDEAFRNGFDDSISKFKGKSHFVMPNLKSWFETFKLLHKLFIENPANPNFEANDPDYKSYLENFNKLLDVDDEFFTKCCETGYKKALSIYDNPLMTHYSSDCHRSLLEESLIVYRKYARGPKTYVNEKQLKEKCDQIWKNGKQQCEYLSLRGNPCVKPKHNNNESHNSGVVFVSTCNCGRTQGRREDPYSCRQANYDFYLVLANNCTTCTKGEKINFAIFEPSINDYRAAELNSSINRVTPEIAELANICDSRPLTASDRSHTNLSLDSSINDLNKINCSLINSDDSVNELVIKVGDPIKDADDKMVIRQPSTTEYLPGMVHTESPIGLLPQFPSWSLICVGPSSVYSHNNGLLEHFQSGFLTGTNFLLPWDVNVRMESSSWLISEKTRYRKRGEIIVLKIFVGLEYECPCGHRFFLAGPDKVVKGGSGLIRDGGNKVVFNDMPLYFPCPCRNNKVMVAQLARIHVVTPKAPVNVIVDPKIKTGERNLIFTMGLSQPPKLSQSSYWILRLPYIYYADGEYVLPPSNITANNAFQYGCLTAGMFGVTETETEQ